VNAIYIVKTIIVQAAFSRKLTGLLALGISGKYLNIGLRELRADILN